MNIQESMNTNGRGNDLTNPERFKLAKAEADLASGFSRQVQSDFHPFEQWQQTEVDSWMALAKELEEQFEGLVYYELPTIQSRNTFYQCSSMRA